MSEEQAPDIEELKEQEKIEIPVEEDFEEPKSQKQGEEPDVIGELKKLGQQVAETLQLAWNSEERVRVENEVREGVQTFVDEIDKVIHEVKTSPKSEKAKNDAMGAKETLETETSNLGRKAREGIVQGLTWFSEELGKLAEQFSPPEKSPEDVGADAAEETE